MKITRVILSSNESREYLDFWPIVSKAWINLGIQPTLVYTGEEALTEPNIINLNIKSINSAFVAQNVRLLAPALFPEDVCIISDIDDMPLSKKYFQDNIKDFDDDKFIIYRPDAVPENMISIMWNAAKGQVWSKIFDVYNLNDIKNKLISWYPNNYSVRGQNWYFDQIILRNKINTFHEKFPSSVIELSDELTGFNRLNRSKLKRNFRKFYIEGTDYTDFHMPRPYKKHKKLIDKVYEIHFNKNIF